MSNGEPSGPYLAAAVLCERVLQEINGTLSAIRIVDRFMATVQGPTAPEAMPLVQVNLTALIIFKSGDAKGSYQVKLQAVSPSGFRTGEMSVPILLEGDERGAHVIFEIKFQTQEPGLYWFDVSLNEDLVTRIPLRVLYQRVLVGQSGGTPIH
jgi:hypothetical protein